MSETTKPCPICGKPSTPAHSPFCSKRCSHLDLGRWLGGNYAIPAEELDLPSDDDELPPPRMH